MFDNWSHYNIAIFQKSQQYHGRRTVITLQWRPGTLSMCMQDAQPLTVNQTTDAAPVPTIDSGAFLVVYSANDIHHVLMSCGAVYLSWRLTTMINLNRSMDRSVTACCQKEKTVIPLVGAPYVKVAYILLLSFTILIFFKRRSSITNYIAVWVIKSFTRTSHLIIYIETLLALCSFIHKYYHESLINIQ